MVSKCEECNFECDFRDRFIRTGTDPQGCLVFSRPIQYLKISSSEYWKKLRLKNKLKQLRYPLHYGLTFFDIVIYLYRGMYKNHVAHKNICTSLYRIKGTGIGRRDRNLKRWTKSTQWSSTSWEKKVVSSRVYQSPKSATLTKAAWWWPYWMKICPTIQLCFQQIKASS